MTTAQYKETLEILANKCSFVENSFSDINLFGVLGVQRNEVLICRVLGYLLMPNSIESIGIEPLRLFLNQVNCGCVYTDQELQAASVVLEEHIDNDRRVDIVIYVGRDVYPIEVKVDAEDQPAQLFDYYYYFKDKKKGEVEKIYYLTPNGRSPSFDSISSRKKNQRKQLPQDVVKCLSFGSDIWQWLERLLQNCPVNDNYIFLLKQFKDVIMAMCASDKNQENLYEALGLNTEQSFQSSAEVKVLLNILNLDQNALWEKIRDRYLRTTLDLGDKYKLESAPNAEIDKHSLYVVKRIDTEEEIAWICVETNLYIVSKYPVSGLKGTDNYYWKYLSPKDAQQFPLKKPNPSISESDKIKISDLLKQIDTALRNNK